MIPKPSQKRLKLFVTYTKAAVVHKSTSKHNCLIVVFIYNILILQLLAFFSGVPQIIALMTNRACKCTSSSIVVKAIADSAVCWLLFWQEGVKMMVKPNHVLLHDVFQTVQDSGVTALFANPCKRTRMPFNTLFTCSEVSQFMSERCSPKLLSKNRHSRTA